MKDLRRSTSERRSSVLTQRQRSPTAALMPTPPSSSTTFSDERGILDNGESDESTKSNGSPITSAFVDSTSIGSISTAPKRLIELMRDLSFLAIDNHGQIHLPRVVVTGDQSVGKSSLIEAITGITVPRDDGTCTRVSPVIIEVYRAVVDIY